MIVGQQARIVLLTANSLELTAAAGTARAYDVVGVGFGNVSSKVESKEQRAKQNLPTRFNKKYVDENEKNLLPKPKEFFVNEIIE